MGFLASLFKKNPATKRPTKIDLIKSLVKKRVHDDPMASFMGFDMSMVDQLPELQLMGLPEGTIVTIVETYATLKRHGASDSEIFERIEAHRRAACLGNMPSNLDLERYIEYRVALEHTDGTPLPEAHVSDSVLLARTYFRC